MADCTRCKCALPAKPPQEGWVNQIFMTRETWTWKLRLNMWRLRWMPEYADERARLTYSELQLCSPCAGDVFAFAAGKADR